MCESSAPKRRVSVEGNKEINVGSGYDFSREQRFHTARVMSDALGRRRSSDDVRYPSDTDRIPAPLAIRRYGPGVDGSGLARRIFTSQAWVGAAMCSACLCGPHDRWP
jgi:hypothetical protein